MPQNLNGSRLLVLLSLLASFGAAAAAPLAAAGPVSPPGLPSFVDLARIVIEAAGP
jgi:hypothetical protein